MKDMASLGGLTLQSGSCGSGFLSLEYGLYMRQRPVCQWIENDGFILAVFSSCGK
jgi:hypothetical protein